MQCILIKSTLSHPRSGAMSLPPTSYPLFSSNLITVKLQIVLSHICGSGSIYWSMNILPRTTPLKKLTSFPLISHQFSVAPHLWLELLLFPPSFILEF